MCILPAQGNVHQQLVLLITLLGGGGFLRFGNGLCICVLDTSCHTAGHVSYIMTEAVILVTVSVEMERG